MNGMRQVGMGFSMALMFSAIVIGSLSLSLLESATPLALAPLPTATITPGLFPFSTWMVQEASVTPTPSLPLVPMPSPTITPTPNCAYPQGWVSIEVPPDETLDSLARIYQIDPVALAEGNCIVTKTLPPGSWLFVPHPLPTATQARRCGPPAGWVRYSVRLGDTLYGLSLGLGVTEAQLQFANCLGNKRVLNTGQVIYVPFIPAVIYPTPYPTLYPTPTRWMYPTWTLTFTPPPATRTAAVPPSRTPTRVVTQPPTNTPSGPPTNTPAAPPTNTPVIPPTNTLAVPPSSTPVTPPPAEPPTAAPPTAPPPPTAVPPTEPPPPTAVPPTKPPPPTAVPPTVPPPPTAPPPPTEPPSTYP